MTSYPAVYSKNYMIRIGVPNWMYGNVRAQPPTGFRVLRTSREVPDILRTLNDDSLVWPREAGLTIWENSINPLKFSNRFPSKTLSIR